MFEAIQFADGQILNGTLGDYRVPRFADVPPIDIVLARSPRPAVGRRGRDADRRRGARYRQRRPRVGANRSRAAHSSRDLKSVLARYPSPSRVPAVFDAIPDRPW